MLAEGVQACKARAGCSAAWVGADENTKARKEGERPLSRNHDRVKTIPHAGVRSVQRDLDILRDEVQHAGRMFSFSSANMFLVLLNPAC